jgi:hypothetical protein
MSKSLVVDPRAAFVDVGGVRMHVSVGGERAEIFGTVTAQLHALRDWVLAVREVRHVRTEGVEKPLLHPLLLLGSHDVLPSGNATPISCTGRACTSLVRAPASACAKMRAAVAARIP